jgi:hypothetical protein
MISPEMGHLLKCNLMIFRGGTPYLFTMTWRFSGVGHLLKCKLMIFRGGPSYICTVSWRFSKVDPLSLYYELMIFRVLGQASFYFLEPAVNTVLCRLWFSEFALHQLKWAHLWGQILWFPRYLYIKDVKVPRRASIVQDREAHLWKSSTFACMYSIRKKQTFYQKWSWYKIYCKLLLM